MGTAILVATDGSEPADRAVEHAMERAAESAGTVHVISVVDTQRYGEPALSSAELVLDDLEDRAQALLAEVAERGAGRDVEVFTRSCHGEPHEEILAYADEIDADRLVLGRHGLSRTGHHIGSVSNRVVKGTDRPVQLL